MKRSISMMFAAALMMLGLTSVTFAHDEQTPTAPKTTSAVVAESAKPVKPHKVRTHHVLRNSKHAAATTVSEHAQPGQGTATESAKSAVASPSLPTTPTTPVAKTVTTPTAPSTPTASAAPALLPTK